METLKLSFEKTECKEQMGWISTSSSEHFVSIQIHELHMADQNNKTIIFRRFINSVNDGYHYWTTCFNYDLSGDLIRINPYELLPLDVNKQKELDEIWSKHTFINV